MNEIAISAVNVSKQFRLNKNKLPLLVARSAPVNRRQSDEIWAIDDISLEIGKGEAVGIIGGTGCGKTTLIRLLDKTLTADCGEISVSGSAASLSETEASLRPELSGTDNIYAITAALGIKRKDAVPLLPKIIEFSELGEFINHPVKNYSSGMRIQLICSAVLLSKPDILLIDELRINEPHFRSKCEDALLQFRNDGGTIVIASHDLTATEKLCTRVIWLDKGKISADGSPKQTVNLYLETMSDRRDRTFLLEAEMAAGNDEPRSRWGDRSIELTGVDVLNGNGRKHANFDPEEKMIICIHYKINKPVSDVGFSISIFGTDNVLRYSTSTYIDGALVDIKQNGKISCVIDRVGFMEGCYRIDAAVHDREGVPYDYVLGIAKFFTSSPISDSGMMRPPHSWEN